MQELAKLSAVIGDTLSTSGEENTSPATIAIPPDRAVVRIL